MMIAVLFEEWHTCRHGPTNTHTRKQREREALNRRNIPVICNKCTCFSFVCMCTYIQTHSHTHILITHSHHQSEGPALWFLLFKAPHGECIGHLTHAPLFSEYTSNTAISSWPLKHHVPHGTVWPCGLNIYLWISPLKCHLAFSIKPIL